MKIWFRVGVDINISEDEYRILKSERIETETKELLFKELLKRAELRGESYAPEMDGLGNEYINEQEDFKEINFLL